MEQFFDDCEVYAVAFAKAYAVQARLSPEAISQGFSEWYEKNYRRIAATSSWVGRARMTWEAAQAEANPTPSAIERAARNLAKFIAQKESTNCKTLDESLHHQSKWERIVPEAKEMLEAAFGEELGVKI